MNLDHMRLDVVSFVELISAEITVIFLAFSVELSDVLWQMTFGDYLVASRAGNFDVSHQMCVEIVLVLEDLCALVAVENLRDIMNQTNMNFETFRVSELAVTSVAEMNILVSVSINSMLHFQLM
jgi:hypothetical protein